MRLLLLFAVVVAAGMLAGVFTGRVVSGNTRPPESVEPLGAGDTFFPGETLPHAGRLSSHGESLPRMSRSEALPQVAQRVSHSEGIPSVSGHIASPSHRGTLAIAVGSPDQVYQVSRQVRSSLRLMPTGDANLDGLVNREDLRLVAGALGSVPTDHPVVDWNGDGRVDVLDLAIVAAHLGELLP